MLLDVLTVRLAERNPNDCRYCNDYLSVRALLTLVTNLAQVFNSRCHFQLLVLPLTIHPTVSSSISIKKKNMAHPTSQDSIVALSHSLRPEEMSGEKKQD